MLSKAGLFLKKQKIPLTVFVISIIVLAFIVNAIIVKNKKAEYAAHWRRYVTVQARWKYRADSASITDVTVKVTNKLPYVVEHARVLIQYMYGGTHVFRSEIVDVYNIPANSIKIENAPNGMKPSYPRTNIGYLKCTEIGLN